MTDQLAISEDGRIVSQPVTWDGEPLYSEDTVREGLFDRSAFEQMPGQIAIEPCYCPDDCACRKPWRPTICGCDRHES